MTILANTARWLKHQARARGLASRTRGTHHIDLPAVLLLSDASRLADPRPALARLPRGAGVVLRDYENAGSRDGRMRTALALKRACRARGLRLIVAGDAALALRIGADGVHLPEWQLRQGGAVPRRRNRPPGFIVTCACHSLTALIRARRADVDAALVAPVFATDSHPGTRPLGVLRFARLAHASGLPVLALGGIDPITARRLLGSGAGGIAGIGFAAAP